MTDVIRPEVELLFEFFLFIFLLHTFQGYPQKARTLYLFLFVKLAF